MFKNLGIGSPEQLALAKGLPWDALAAADLHHWIDHTLLKPEATAAMVDQWILEGQRFQCASVCVNSYWTARVAAGLKDSGVRCCAVIGFPLGASSFTAKKAEAQQALADGADELDVVLNIGAFKSGWHQLVLAELKSLVTLCQHGKLVKLILETALLSNAEIEQACRLAVDAGVHFVKTSTGFGNAGASIEHVRLMRKCVGDRLGVKASGGIQSTQQALDLIHAGASRIGSSQSLRLMGRQS